ncbi:limonene-1,2-epoxide hydrolase family protein [Pseudonocardia halophobica]|uniref:limonene-1,2-epoxide hydrolase family protein n=1 Tax=Pseudonocardia halophobica TaxID=29401 RepID=UPI003D8AB060
MSTETTVTPANDLEKRSLKFFAAWSNSDADELLGYFADDAVYHNVPLAPLHGKQAIEGFLRPYFQAVGLDIITTAIATTGRLVLSERLDILKLQDGRTFDLPVTGAMEFDENGLITAWRDYFDLGSVERGTGLSFG